MNQKELENVVNMLVSPDETDAILAYDIFKNNHDSLLIPVRLRHIIEFSPKFVTNKYFRWSNSDRKYIILDMGGYQAIRWLQRFRDGNNFKIK